MVTHNFELINGKWSVEGRTATTSLSLKQEIEQDKALEGLDVRATVNEGTLTVYYNDRHIDNRKEKHELQVLTARIAHRYVIEHAMVKRKGANIIRFRYTFERTA